MKVIIITGGTNGVGRETARILAVRNPSFEVVISGRSDSSISKTIKSEEFKSLSNVSGIPLELTDPSSVRNFASIVNDNVSKQGWEIVAFLHNAGLQFPTLEISSSGIEKTFHANHIGCFHLHKLLLPTLTKNPCRIIVTSSNTHDPKQGIPYPPDYALVNDLAFPDEKTFNNFRAYTNSKLCNVLFTYYAAKHLPSHVTINAYNPGWIPETGLVREYGFIIRFILFYILPLIVPYMTVGSTLKRSCNYLASLVDGEDLGTGKYYDIDVEANSSDWSYDEERQKKLWEFSEKLVENF